jgi:hypothetical protein
LWGKGAWCYNHCTNVLEVEKFTLGPPARYRTIRDSTETLQFITQSDLVIFLGFPVPASLLMNAEPCEGREHDALIIVQMCSKLRNYHLYVQVTMHHDNLCINNQQDASSIQNFILSRNSTCFWHLLCPSSEVIGCTRGNWYISCRLCGRCLGESQVGVPNWLSWAAAT